MADQLYPSLESFLEEGDTPKPRPNEVAKTFKRRSINIDLQKSIKLLDDAVSPSVNRQTRTPRSGFRRSHYTPSKPLDDSRYNASVSDMFMITPAKQKTPKANSMLQGRGDFNTQLLSPVVTGVNKTQLNLEVTGEVDMTEDVTQTNMTFIPGEDLGLKADARLAPSFHASMKQHPAPHQAMDLLASYTEACGEQVRGLKEMHRGQARSQPRMARTVTSLDLLRGELETWQLIRCLYKDRLETEAGTPADAMDEGGEGGIFTKVWSLSEKNIASHLFERDALIRQSQLVVDWLEQCAAEDLDTFSENAKFFVDQPVAWENTLHHLQNLKQGHRSNRDRPTVTELDPDAPHRQMKALDDLDKEDERFLVKNLFWCLRAGKLDTAQELCHRCGQPWRAATLEGWRLAHDPNYYSSSHSEGLGPVEGNACRDVWKAVCWRMCAEPEIDKYEKALYAALSGHLDALLPACSSWMDHLWAYYRVMVDMRVEQEVRLHHHKPRTVDPMPQEYWDKMLEPHDIFKEIGASIQESIRQQSQHWHHVIQKYIVLGDIPGLIEVMYSWLQQERDFPPQHLLRLMVHIVLFLRNVGHACKEELCEAIIEAYVTDLIKGKNKSLVAHYVATLKVTSQVQWYASFLEDVVDPTERSQCLQWADEEGLEVAAITKAVVERVRARGASTLPPEDSLAPDLTVTEEDKSKIEAIDWLVFTEAHRGEALRQANAIMRSFIAVKKHLAARQAFEKLPPDSIEVIYRQWHVKMGGGEGMEDLPPADNNAIREYMCMKAYLDAVESFNDWFSLYHQGQPVQPAGLESVASFTDRVAMEHKMKQYSMEHERWRHNLLTQTRATRDRIYNVLLFADGGWLVDTQEDPEADEGRAHQMATLRALHLPSLCLSLHTVLHQSDMFADAVAIADVIASEQHRLYQDFEPSSLQHLLSQIARSSRCLLDDNKDPLGYQVV